MRSRMAFSRRTRRSPGSGPERHSGRGCCGSWPTRRATGVVRRTAGPASPCAPPAWPGRTPCADSPEAEYLAGEAREQLRAAFGLLRDEDREVIGARYFLELSEAETAEALALPAGTVKSRTSRALGRLREALAAIEGGRPMADQPIVPLRLRSDDDLGAALRAMAARRRLAGRGRDRAGQPDLAATVRARLEATARPARPTASAPERPRLSRLALDPGAAGARPRDRRPARPRGDRRRRRARVAGPPDHLRRSVRGATGVHRRAPRRPRHRRCRRVPPRPRLGHTGPARHGSAPWAGRRPGDARRARRASRSRMPADPSVGAPDTAWVDPTRNDQVSLVWASSARLPATDGAGHRPDPDRVPGSGRRRLVHEGARPGHDHQPGDASTAQRGYWVSGDPHQFFYEGPTGFVEESRRWVGDVLLWTDGTITYRLETSLGRDARSPSPSPCPRRREPARPGRCSEDRRHRTGCRHHRSRPMSSIVATWPRRSPIVFLARRPRRRRLHKVRGEWSDRCERLGRHVGRRASQFPGRRWASRLPQLATLRRLRPTDPSPTMPGWSSAEPATTGCA